MCLLTLGPVVLRLIHSSGSPLSQKYVCFCVQSFREELDGLIQEQMKKGGSSSNLWALRQLADFMATHGSPAALPVSPSSKGKRTLLEDVDSERMKNKAKTSSNTFFYVLPVVFAVLVLYLNHFAAFSRISSQSIQP